MSYWNRLNKKPIDVESFRCIRLTENPENKPLIQGFNNEKNCNLAWDLKRGAWGEDLTNYRAYYLVKEKNRIVFYFSLQCGMMVKCHEKVLGGISHREGRPSIEYYIDDDIIDVTRVIPAIELGHFCVNDSYLRKKVSNRIMVGEWEYTIGVYVFYTFIAPKIIELASITGLQYVYLFCADDGSHKLVDYYSSSLGFSIMDNMACLRPKYDQGTLCCMTLKYDDLIVAYNRFQDLSKVHDLMAHIQAHTMISIEQAKRLYKVWDPQYLFSKMADKNLVVVDSIITASGMPARIKKKS